MKMKGTYLTACKFRYGIYILCALATLQWLSLPVYAASNKNSDFSQLVSKADVVVFGRCTAVSSEWRKKKIYSIASIEVINVIEGNAPNVIKIEYMGGTAVHPKLNTPIQMKVSNGISFSAGDEAVLMLNRLDNGIYRVLGAERGKIPVVTDVDSGEKIIQSGAEKMVSKPSGEGDTVTLSGRPMNLEEFTEYIHSRKQIEKNRSEQ